MKKLTKSLRYTLAAICLFFMSGAQAFAQMADTATTHTMQQSSIVTPKHLINPNGMFIPIVVLGIFMVLIGYAVYDARHGVAHPDVW